ncbi:MAG: fructose-1,6-bisphosphatase [Rikenellaceae bacterium]
MNRENNLSPEQIRSELKYLQLLSNSFPNVSAACTEIINLEAILNLPKGTEHFLTDIHGEYEAFQHVLRNGSGVIRGKIEEIFGTKLRETEKRELCTLIYYNRHKLRHVKDQEKDMDEWYRITLHRLIVVCQSVSSKYTRSKVRKALPAEYSYIIQELLHESMAEANKYDYFNVIINTIISTGRADNFIVAMSNLIQQLTIDSLHIVGDIYDRGPGAHQIMDMLCDYHNLDIQWGNHDLLWMGAASGCKASIANVIRISLRYANMATLEEGYGINLLPLATFAIDTYGNDDCQIFMPRMDGRENIDQRTSLLLSQMHKAIAIIQFKLEAQLIDKYSEYGMQDRKLLHRIDFDKATIELDGKIYNLRTGVFPTVDPEDPYKLTPQEHDLMDKLQHSFASSDKMRTHMKCLYSKGSLYLVHNSNLLYHAAIPLNPDGSFKQVSIGGQQYSGRALLDKIDYLVRQAYFAPKGSAEREFACDYMWYLWCGSDSPAFNKDRMTTFERYFVEDKSTHKEISGSYFIMRDSFDTCNMILEEFGLDSACSHIINGHIPVQTVKGENPMRAEGKMLVIDGGFSKAYQSTTGIAGYTLIYNSHGLLLVQHEPFESRQNAIDEGVDIISTRSVLEFKTRRMMVRDTDIGRELKGQIDELEKLVYAYQNGHIKERH